MTNIYIDENFAPQLAQGLDVFQEHLNKKERFQLKVISVRDEFGEGATDETWIPIAGQQKALVITQDFRIHTTRHQNELYKKYGLGVFFFKPPSKGYTFWEMVEQVIKRWPEIKKKNKNQRPFAYSCSNRTKFKPLA